MRSQLGAQQGDRGAKLQRRSLSAWTADHIISVSQGGTNELDNLQAAHASCYAAHGARLKQAKGKGLETSTVPSRVQSRQMVKNSVESRQGFGRVLNASSPAARRRPKARAVVRVAADHDHRHVPVPLAPRLVGPEAAAALEPRRLWEPHVVEIS